MTKLFTETGTVNRVRTYRINREWQEATVRRIQKVGGRGAETGRERESRNREGCRVETEMGEKEGKKRSL